MTQENEVTRFFRILEIIKAEFSPRDAYVLEGVPTFIIPLETQLVEKLDRLGLKLASEGLGLTVERRDEGLLLQVSPVEKAPTVLKSRFFGANIALVLFIVTIGTVTLSGYMTASSYVGILQVLGKIRPQEENLTIWLQTLLYTVTIMSTIGLHELGHTLACRRHRVEASLPLFIPGIPGITPGTFGAFIMQKTPARDRNQLFDIGVAGPLVGFFVALAASFVGYSLSLPVTQAEYNILAEKLGEGEFVFLPLLFMFLQPYLFRKPGTYTLIMHPLALAAWLATLITSLNAFPIGQLDGGHVSRAVLGSAWHRRLGYAMLGLMVLAGWFPMAILVLLIVRTGHPGILDDATPLSPIRKLVALAFLAMFLASFTLSPESPLLLFLFT